ncbi:MAG TPA: MATE family efflux transporter [Dehalococcoidia bacterium]
MQAEETAVRSLFADPSRSIRAILVRLAWPVVAERLSLSILSAVDALLVGRYVGADGVAAVGIGALLFWVPLAGAFGAEVAATALVGRAVGRGSLAEVERAARTAVAAGLAWGVAVALAMAGTAPQLMRLMGAEPEIADLGARYIRLAALGLPFLLLLHVAAGVLRGMGNTVWPMAVLLVLNVVNLVVTFGLISGVVGLELGVAASGLGYGLAGVTGGVLSLALLARGYGGFRYRPSLRGLLPEGEALRRFLRLAVPTTLEELQFMTAFLVYTRIIASAGTTAVAAHTIALRSLEVAIVPGFALGTAATAAVGQAMGMERPDLAEAVGRTARTLSLVVMLALGGTLGLTAPWVARLFVAEREVADTAALLLRIFVLAYPIMGMSAALSGVLRGAGDVRYVLGVMTFTTWCVRIPAAWTLAIGLGLGVPGAWLGAVAENSVRGGLVLLRFHAGRWKRARA